MRKLTQTYAWSAMQLNALERPKLPPPPTALVPVGGEQRLEGEDKARPTTAAPASSTFTGAPSSKTPHHVSGLLTEADIRGVSRVPDASAAHSRVPHPVPTPHMGIDSVLAPPQTPPSANGSVSDGSQGLAPGARTGTPVQPNIPPPPDFAGGRRLVPGQMPERSATGTSGRVRSSAGSTRPGTPTAGPLAHGQASVTGRPPRSPGRGPQAGVPERAAGSAPRGIVGGHPVTPPGGKLPGAIPRGTVVGGRSGSPSSVTPAGQFAPPAGRTSQSRPAPGRAAPPAPRGIVGGRQRPNSAATGTSAQRSGPAGRALPGSGDAETTGAAHTSGASGARRGGGSTGDQVTGAVRNSGSGAGPQVPRTPRPVSPPAIKDRSERSRRTPENEDPRQPDNRRTAPPATG